MLCLLSLLIRFLLVCLVPIVKLHILGKLAELKHTILQMNEKLPQ